jgi:predicted DNA-binding protein (MmcQ/YjbR family)
MTVDSVRAFCLSFPRATENLQWGEELCFKVNGKIFAVLALGSVPQTITFKCNPEVFAELTDREGIAPAPYVGRYKWVQVDRLDVLSDFELKRLIRDSYEMVVTRAKSAVATRRKRVRRKMAG